MSVSLIDGGSNIVVSRASLATWQYRSSPLDPLTVADLDDRLEGRQFAMTRFTDHRIYVHFPLWYPALIFTLAGVATLRLGRRFTLRSAIIATTVVAGLLGMVVAL